MNHGDAKPDRKLPLRRDCLHGRGRSGDGITCNRSICSRLGAVWAFTPAAKFKLTKGEGKLGDYQFNKHVAHHRYCPSCGIESFAQGKGKDGSDQVGINLRCCDGIDVNKLSPKQVDGRSF